jgi:prolyl-tRNA synthetase
MAKEKKQGVSVKKDDDMSEWYTQVITKSELIDYTDVSGCMVFRPYSYAIWEKIVKAVDDRLKRMGV